MDRAVFINKISKKLEKDEGAIFVGSGISKSCTGVDWVDLLVPLANDLGITLNENDDLPLIAQYIVNNYSGNRGPLINEIFKVFNRNFPINNYLKYLATTKVSTIWTTNYDTLLESAFSDFNVSVKVNDDSITRNVLESDIEIIKMHGCTQKSNYNDIVITQEDYDDFLLNKPAIAQRLCEDLTNKSFLFIGYSYRDPNVKNIMVSARRLSKNHTQEHFLIAKKVDSDKEQIRRQELWCNDLKRSGISTLLINDYDELEDILKDISKKSRGKTVFVTGSHNSNSEDIRDLGRLMAMNPEVVLLSGQSAGVGSNVAAAFTEECINNKTDIMNRIKIFPNPYAANKKYSDNPILIPDLKRCRVKLLNSAQVVVVFGGGIGTEAEVELAIKQNCYLIPVIAEKEDRNNKALVSIFNNNENMENIKMKAPEYYKKLLDKEAVTSMEEVNQCIMSLLK